jgi:hypothetical protein
LTRKSLLRVVVVAVVILVLLGTAPMIGTQVEFFVWIPAMVAVIAVAILVLYLSERRRGSE